MQYLLFGGLLFFTQILLLRLTHIVERGYCLFVLAEVYYCIIHPHHSTFIHSPVGVHAYGFYGFAVHE